MRVWRSSARIALEAKAAEFDHHFVGTERGDDVATQRRAAQIEVHAREHVDHVPLVRRQMRERQRRAAVEAFVLLVIDFESADDDVTVIERFVLAREVGIVKSGDAVMVVHEVVIKFAIGVVPQLVVRVHDRLVIVENFKRLGVERLAQAGKCGPGPIFERTLRVVVEIDPDKAAEFHFATQAAQADVFLAQAILEAFLLAADVNAIASHVVLPGVEHAGHALWIAGGLAFEKAAGRTPLDDHAAVRADVEKRANLIVRAAADDDRLARDGNRAEIVGIRQFGFVADRNPGLFEDLLVFFFEDLRIRINATVDPLRFASTSVPQVH